MSLFLDFIIVLVFVLCIITGVKRGFIRSVMGIVIVVAAIIGSIKFTPKVAEYLNKNYITPGITSKVEKSIDSVVNGVESVDLKKLFSEKSQALTDILEKFGVEFDDARDYYEKEAEKSDDPEKKIAGFIAKPLADTVSKAAAFALLFIAISAVLGIILIIVDLLANIPILKEINKSLGLIFGLIKGALYSWGLSLIFCSLLPNLSVLCDGKIPASVIDNTIIVKLLGSFSISGLF